jgi:hypothetical protein
VERRVLAVAEGRSAETVEALAGELASLPREAPRLCRGGSQGLT